MYDRRPMCMRGHANRMSGPKQLHDGPSIVPCDEFNGAEYQSFGSLNTQSILSLFDRDDGPLVLRISPIPLPVLELTESGQLPLFPRNSHESYNHFTHANLCKLSPRRAWCFLIRHCGWPYSNLGAVAFSPTSSVYLSALLMFAAMTWVQAGECNLQVMPTPNYTGTPLPGRPWAGQVQKNLQNPHNPPGRCSTGQSIWIIYRIVS